jgi:hypothetical protein
VRAFAHRFREAEQLFRGLSLEALEQQESTCLRRCRFSPQDQGQRFARFVPGQIALASGALPDLAQEVLHSGEWTAICSFSHKKSLEQTAAE